MLQIFEVLIATVPREKEYIAETKELYVKSCTNTSKLERQLYCSCYWLVSIAAWKKKHGEFLNSPNSHYSVSLVRKRPSAN